MSNIEPPRLYLTEPEIADICKPLTMPAAQYRFITQRLGMRAARKPSGRVLLARSEFERVLGAPRDDAPAEVMGDLESLRARWNRHGAPA
ncbi:hypothetical protein [Candidimonas nitroreducens]|uniref:DUF4224 domain-containing protein n=1 Tax=Candidimonas nitroreducens TaxID=683354 RepID=A0A225M1L3_9BURK|nr:hypothetical protein [Candidimonas nitroreducens]OWT55234.1 hypothetical protein CEY11_21225 [Candidimonas nitroreducens]